MAKVKEGKDTRKHTLAFEQIPIDLALDLSSDVRLAINVKDTVIELRTYEYGIQSRKDEEKPFRRGSEKKCLVE